MITQTPLAERCRALRALHASGCFVIPNPWDVGSARYLVSLGFRALATTSAGFAWTIGRADGHVTREEMLAHCRAMAAAVDVPIHADFEHGYAVAPEAVAANVAEAADTGIAALSIEDSTGDPSRPLFEADLAVERVRAARRALDETAPEIMLTARHEGWLVGKGDVAETIRRLTAFAAAGADCLYAPGMRDLNEIAAVVKAVAPKPVNVLVGSGFTTMQALAAIGVRRISVGGALARSAWGGFMTGAREIAERGTFEALGRGAAWDDMQKVFGGA